VADTTVSRHHATIEPAGRTWLVHDAGSRNGTYLNDRALRGPTNLALGDRIRLGGCAITICGHPPPVVATEEPAEIRARHGLSARECEVLHLLAQGATDRTIADTLYISLATVHSHLDRIRDKTQRRRRSELARLAADLGLV
jgi:DNA-binding CsgD family transcriptional regulator